MNQFENISAKWKDLQIKAQPTLEKAGLVWSKGKKIMSLIGLWAYRLRKFLFSVPIVWLSVYLARLNHNLLPDMVGIDLQTTGEYAMYVTKEVAVYGPLGVTAACLLMMFLSRKTLYPWLICMISLALPLLVLLTNIFPA